MYILKYFKIYFMMCHFAWKVVNSCGTSLCVKKSMRGNSIRSIPSPRARGTKLSTQNDAI